MAAMFRRITQFSKVKFPSSIYKNRNIIISAMFMSTVIHTNRKNVCFCDHQESIVNPNTISVPEVSPSTSKDSKLSLIEKCSAEVQRAIRYCRRICEYLLYGLPVALMAPVAYAVSSVAPSTEDLIWCYAIWAIEQLGPTFVKFAQWASTRPDLYPAQLITRLRRLQDDVTVHHSFQTVEMTLSDAFGPDWKSVLNLDRKPLGAGCIAQVFKGDLKSGNESVAVAVKLIHPHVQAMVQTDMELLGFLASMIDSFPTLELLAFGDTCRQFAEMMQDQLDLRKEAHNLKQFSSMFKLENWVKFPQPIDGYISKNVLIETLEEGKPLLSYMTLADDAFEGARKLKLKLSDMGCRAVMKMIFFDNFVHGDLHPGNILVQILPSGEPRFVFLDCGLVFQSKTEADHLKLVDICMAFMKHDGNKAGRLMVDNARTKGYKSIHDSEEFSRQIQKMIDDTINDNFYDKFGEYVAKICELARTYAVKLDPNYFHIAMALKVVEGVSMSLNKELDMITECTPILVKAQAMRKLGIMKFPTPEDRDKQ